MGKKGDKQSQDGASAVEDLLDKFSAISGVSSKKMFGGYGIFHEGKMFGIIDSKGNSFLKVTDENRKAFDDAGAEQHSRMPYFSIPSEVLTNQKTLISWAKKSIKVSK